MPSESTIAAPLVSSEMATEPLIRGDRAAACVGAVALITLLAFEALAVAAAMPAVAAAMDGVSSYALAFGAPLAASVLGMVLAGRWCDRHGAHRATAVGLVLFAAGLLAATLADGMAVLVCGRLLQGLGGGLLGVALYVGMGQLVPAALHPRLFSLFATAWVLPGLAGPTVAAWLVTHVGWRAVFGVALVSVPVTAWLLLPAFARLPRPANPPVAPRRDVAWAALGAGGALLLHAVAQADSNGLRAVLFATGAVAAGLAALRLLPAGTLRAGAGLPSVVALRGLLAASFATAEVFLPLLLTRGAGWSIAEAGLVLTSATLSWSAGSAVQSRLVDPARRRRGLALGLALVALGIGALAAGIGRPWHGGAIALAWAVAGFGIGLSFPMLSVLTLALSPPAEQGRNASALQLADALVSTAALAVAGLLFNLTASGGSVLAWAAALAALGVPLARRAFVAAR